MKKHIVPAPVLLTLLGGLLIACNAGVQPAVSQRSAAAPAQYGYRVVKAYPHDRGAFTQGLEYREGFLYEGTGIEGRSGVRKVELDTGRVIQSIPIDGKYFGEGITVFNNQIIQLTWKHSIGFIYDQPSFRELRTFTYPGEGWGLANDGQQIYFSDGTSEIRILDPVTLQELRRIHVRDGNRPVTMINELEYIRGEIFANIWQTNRIARISPATGQVLGWIDLTGLLPATDRTTGTDVLNGIAFDPLGSRLFVTGKNWPKLFHIELVDK